MCIYTRLYASLEVFSRLQSKGIPKQPHGAFLLSPLRFYDSLLPVMNSSLNNPFKVIEGTVIRVLKTGTTKYAKQWASISTSNSGGHTGTALVRGESFPVTGLALGRAENSTSGRREGDKSSTD